ncbi:MAG: lysine--tRNA ligase [Alphaproteobacteria bacterium]|nr:lysine--tRNA ligase [Alphaproteobacteria bacterium]
MTQNATFNFNALQQTFKPIKSWAVEQAISLLQNLDRMGKPQTETVTFETGYGPSGLPHIGTFGEVLRTSMVKQAFEVICRQQGLAWADNTQLIAFSDDMDGMRKVPDNVPNREMLLQHLGKPLTQVPNPFAANDMDSNANSFANSFAGHNNQQLQRFLDRFGFDYQFISATDTYQSGRFNDGLLNILRNYDAILALMLKNLGDERQQSYSPFLPICPDSGKVLQAKVVAQDANKGTIIYINEQGQECETLVTDGKCKLQWKPDWAMRWYMLGVDYEMAGKDLSESVKISSQITRIMGGTPPVGFSYELFLDEKGEKISKSKGNGLTIDEWLAYAPEESLAWFMYQKPKTAKRLYFDVIPKQVDEYLNGWKKSAGDAELDNEKFDNLRLESPIFHLQVLKLKNQQKPIMPEGVSFAMLLNLSAVCNSDDKQVLWGFISRYAPEITTGDMPYLDRLIGYAIRYYQDFVKPHKQYLKPEGKDKQALQSLLLALQAVRDDAENTEITGDMLQNTIFAIGNEAGYENLRDWFKLLYQTLLGQEQGPRMGSFFMLYGLQNSCELIQATLDGKIEQDLA